jgi:type VI secretion system protein ImpH
MQADRHAKASMVGVPTLSVRQDFHELMRRIDRATPDAPRLGERADLDRKRIDIRQPADFGFASREVSSLRQTPIDGEGNVTIQLELRHFGPFAPYGPMPVDVTEYARDASLGDRQRAFEDFVNLPVARLAVLYYRAWGQLKECVCYDRSGNAFLARLSSTVAATTYAPRRSYLRVLRHAFPGVYLRGAASLPQLESVLERYFATGIRVAPRVAGWIEPKPGDTRNQAHLGRARIGELRIGRRFYDAQHRIGITVGPLAAPDYLDWQGNADRLVQLEDTVRDFVGQRVVCRVALSIRTEPGMAMRLSNARIGRTTWLRPGRGMYRQALRGSYLPATATGDRSC